jgi:hypothetical protein
MQSELDVLAPGAIYLLGVDAVGQESGNAGICAGNTLPWLQDTVSVNAWGTWSASWRDVVLIDTKGVRHGGLNLTQSDLTIPANYDSLKQLLLGLR